MWATDKELMTLFSLQQKRIILSELDKKIGIATELINCHETIKAHVDVAVAALPYTHATVAPS